MTEQKIDKLETLCAALIMALHAGDSKRRPEMYAICAASAWNHAPSSMRRRFSKDLSKALDKVQIKNVEGEDIP